jgi:cytolethal distending toxin subunit B
MSHHPLSGVVHRWLLCTVCLLLWGGARAALSDRVAVSWNMQGGNASTEDKWNTGVLPLLRGGTMAGPAANVVALQEAGQRPASAQIMMTATTPGGAYQEYSWQGGSSRATPYFIYFMQTDPGANRVNLAIVSDQRADEVIVLPPPRAGSRAILGIRLGSEVYFTTHALSGGGTDVPRIVQAAHNSITERNLGYQYLLLGDFNREPPTWDLPAGTERVDTGQMTHTSGHNLDYATSNLIGFAILFNAIRIALIMSDHYPVQVKKK